MRITADEVRLDLRVADLVQHYGLKTKTRGSQYRLRECPRCRAATRDAVAIDIDTGAWLHHGSEREAGGSCSGDILDLVAACEGLDCRRDFPEVLRRAAFVAGLDVVDDVERALRREQAAKDAKARELARIAAEDRAHERSRYLSGTEWHRTLPWHERGAAYLASRSLRASYLCGEGFDNLRFSSAGDLVLAIRDVDGHPLSTATRLLAPSGPKVLTLRDCTTRGTMIDCVGDIRHGRDVVLVEGVVDALTARLAYPNAVILGANGAGAIAHVARAALSRIRVARTRLLLVPHADEHGIGGCTKAGQAALAAGLELDVDLIVVGLPAKDLNDAWQKGWRP